MSDDRSKPPASDAPSDPHHIRGRGFLDSGLYDDAIVELREALDAVPGDLLIMRDLAKAHLMRWRRSLDSGAAESPGTGRATGLAVSDPQEAERLIREALEQAPDDRQSHALIAQLRRVQEQHERERPRPRRPKFLAAAAIALLIVALIVVAILFRDTASPPTPPTAAGETPGFIAELLAPSGEPKTFAGPDGVELVFEMVPGSAHAGMVLEATHVELKLYSTAWFEAEGLITNGTRDVISELEARKELLAEDGTVLLTDHESLLDDHEAPLRPGDVLPIGGTERATPEARRLRLTLTASKRSPAPASYPDDEEMPLHWGMPKPAGVDLVVTHRRQRQNPHMGASWFLRRDISVKNNGSTPVKSLKLEARIKDKNGDQISTDDSWIVGPDDPPLRPGLAYGGTVIEIVDREPAEVELWVARFE